MNRRNRKGKGKGATDVGKGIKETKQRDRDGRTKKRNKTNDGLVLMRDGKVSKEKEGDRDKGCRCWKRKKRDRATRQRIKQMKVLF